MASPRPRRGYVETAFGQVHYWTNGGEGPAVVLLHTSPLSGLEYAGVLPLLAGYRAIAFDTPGYGMSPPVPPPGELANYAAPLCAAIDALGIDRLALAGSHTGAGIALHATAETLGERVTHLVFTGLPMFLQEDVTYFRTNTTRPESSTDGSHLARAWERMRARWGANTDPATFEWALASGLLASDRSSGPTFAVFSYDFAAALARLRGKVLFLNGPHDPLLKYDHRALPCVPQARLEMIDAPAGVSPAHAAPAAYAVALRRFLGS